MIDKKELLNFTESLERRGLLLKSLDELDYEWVIWDYLKKNGHPTINNNNKNNNNSNTNLTLEKDSNILEDKSKKRSFFKAFIRVVKSIALKDKYESFGFDTVEVIREPLIEAKDKAEVKAILLEKYPHFFPNGKVYERESKDQAQFFYVVIFPLYKHEIDLINEGEWKCDYCGHTHENKYISRPIESRKFDGKIFCGSDFRTGNDIVSEPDCYNRWKKEVAFKDVDFPDDLNYINVDSLNYIYKITEKATGKCYVGKTRNAPFFRWWNHLKHSSSPFGIYLKNTKLSDWTFEVLEELPCNISDSEVFKKESEYINKFNSINNGYNSLISNRNAISDVGTLFDVGSD